jgi:DNA polymerase III subunit epsilon
VLRDEADLEAMAATLEASGRYRVLRKLAVRQDAPANLDGPTRSGLFVDVETTGLEPSRHEIIELAMVPFTYGADGQMLAIGQPFHGLREPSHPISPEITRITGLDDVAVAGRQIDRAAVAAFAAGAQLVVAHNAAFDRKFLERFCEVFTTKAWACSMAQVDWGAEGFEGAKLAYLASSAGFFYERHRATHDCHAAIELLARPLPVSGRTGLAHLLDRARRPTWRIWAEHAPYDLKHLLKARGYRWNADGDGAPRAWWTEVAEAEREAELAWLQAEIYCREVEIACRRIDAYDRFSDRW